MAYVGGLGAGKGWLKHQFLLTPGELEDMLAAISCTLVTTNGRVPMDYTHTPLNEYCAQYAKLFSAYDVNSSPLDLHTGLLRPGTRYRWEPIEARLARHQGFKLINLFEPVVHLAPGNVLLGSDCLSFNIISNQAAWIGLVAYFPRVVSFSEERHEYLHDASNSGNAAIYDMIVNSVNAVTRPAVFKTPAAIKRTRLRISDAAKRGFGGLAALKRQGLELK